jgi:hypothetical protein
MNGPTLPGQDARWDHGRVKSEVSAVSGAGAHELRTDEASVYGAVRRMRGSAELFEQHTGALLAAIDGGGRSPWGTGTIGMVVDQINELLGQACGHLHANLDQTGTAIQAMADRTADTERDTTAAVQAVGQELDLSVRHSM